MACLCHQAVTSTLSTSPFMKGTEEHRKRKLTKKGKKTEKKKGKRQRRRR